MLKIVAAKNVCLLSNLAKFRCAYSGTSCRGLTVRWLFVLLSHVNLPITQVWDLGDDGNMSLTIKGHTSPVLGCAFSPADEHTVASVGQGKSVWTSVFVTRVLLWRPWCFFTCAIYSIYVFGSDTRSISH